MSSIKTLTSLFEASVHLLSHKSLLLNLLKEKHGITMSNIFFTKICPIVGASIGQHLRHVIEHMELALNMVGSMKPPVDSITLMDQSRSLDLIYDRRERGEISEKNINMMEQRIFKFSIKLQNMQSRYQTWNNCDARSLLLYPLRAKFDITEDYVDVKLSSTFGRELGFISHHAVHHMAMVKIIAINTGELELKDLPPNFGRAVSTVRYNQQHDK